MPVLLDKLPEILINPLPPVITEKTGFFEMMRQLKAATSQEPAAIESRQEDEARRRESATLGMLEVRQHLGLTAEQRLVKCQPDIYKELYRNGSEIQGAGAMVLRATVHNSNGEAWDQDVWIDDMRKPFSEAANQFFGDIADARDERDGNWVVQHCVDPALNTTPRQQSFIEQPPAELARLPVYDAQPAAIATAA